MRGSSPDITAAIEKLGNASKSVKNLEDLKKFLSTTQFDNPDERADSHRNRNQTSQKEMSADRNTVTQDQLFQLESKLDQKLERMEDKLDARLDRMETNIAEMSKGIVTLTAKVDQIPMQLENQKLQSKLDIEVMLKEQNKEIKSDARYRTTITIAGIGLIVALIQTAPLIIEAINKTSQ